MIFLLIESELGLWQLNLFEEELVEGRGCLGSRSPLQCHVFQWLMLRLKRPSKETKELVVEKRLGASERE